MVWKSFVSLSRSYRASKRHQICSFCFPILLWKLFKFVASAVLLPPRSQPDRNLHWKAIVKSLCLAHLYESKEIKLKQTVEKKKISVRVTWQTGLQARASDFGLSNGSLNAKAADRALCLTNTWVSASFSFFFFFLDTERGRARGLLEVRNGGKKRKKLLTSPILLLDWAPFELRTEIKVKKCERITRCLRQHISWAKVW